MLHSFPVCLEIVLLEGDPEARVSAAGLSAVPIQSPHLANSMLLQSIAKNCRRAVSQQAWASTSGLPFN